MSALPGYINRGCVNTLFLSIRKHLNVRTSALNQHVMRNKQNIIVYVLHNQDDIFILLVLYKYV